MRLLFTQERPDIVESVGTSLNIDSSQSRVNPTVCVSQTGYLKTTNCIFGLLLPPIDVPEIYRGFSPLTEMESMQMSSSSLTLPTDISVIFATLTSSLISND